MILKKAEDTNVSEQSMDAVAMGLDQIMADVQWKLKALWKAKKL